MKYIFVFMLIVSFITSFFTNTVSVTSESFLNGARESIEVVLSFAGIMCMWSGFLEVLKEGGAIEFVKKLINPVIKILFPKLPEKSQAKGLIGANISANLLGVGNAATPAGIDAMNELDKLNKAPEYASEEMSIFAVMNTASIQLIPTTVIALRASMGSKTPESVILPVWISSFVAFLASVTMMKMINKLKRRG